MGAMSEKTLVVLAAGMGSRYGGLKQMDAVGPNGETILEYSVFDAVRAGFGKAVFVIRREFEGAFREMAAERFGGRVAVEFAFQELEDLPEGFNVPAGRTKPWGTTQAVLAAEGLVECRFAVINADDFYGAESYAALAGHMDAPAGKDIKVDNNRDCCADSSARPAEFAMVGYRLGETLTDAGAVARGLCRVDEGGLLESIVELTHVEKSVGGARSTDAAGMVTELSGDETVSMNMWGFTPQVFGQLRLEFARFLEVHGGDLKAECYLPNTVNGMIRGGAGRARVKVRVLRSSSRWFGVTYREDRARVVEEIERLVESGVYPARLWA